MLTPSGTLELFALALVIEECDVIGFGWRLPLQRAFLVARRERAVCYQYS